MTLGNVEKEFTAAKYQQDELHIEQTALSKIADAVGTPAYVYSKSYLTDQYNLLSEALSSTPHQIHYSVKANSNLAILAILSRSFFPAWGNLLKKSTSRSKQELAVSTLKVAANFCALWLKQNC